MALKSNFLTEKYGEELEPLLRKLYLDERMTMKEIGEVLGVGAVAIYYRLKKFGIPTRDRHDHPTSDKVRENARRVGRGRKGTKQTAEAKRKMSDAKKGRMLNPSEYGGHTKNRSGYVYVYNPTHPHCSSDGYVMEHRLVIEQYIGRHLKKDESVHHINRNRKDNRLENLQLMTRSEHAKLHAEMKRNLRKGESI